MRNGVSRQAAVLGAALFGLTAIVAVASRAHGPGGGSTRAVSTDVLLEYVALLGLVLLMAIVVSGFYLAVNVYRGGHWTPPPRASLWRTIVTLLVLVATLLALISVFGHVDFKSRPLKPPPRKPNPSSYKPPVGKSAPFDWVPVAVVCGLTLVAVVAAGAILLRRRVPKWKLEERVADALLVALDESLDDLLAEPDPRRAVIAAYARMERALSVAGLRRHDAEAPREYLARTLPAVGAGAVSVERLTALFEQAKFSTHDVGVGMKTEAIAALAALRDELRGSG